MGGGNYYSEKKRELKKNKNRNEDIQHLKKGEFFGIEKKKTKKKRKEKDTVFTYADHALCLRKRKKRKRHFQKK